MNDVKPKQFTVAVAGASGYAGGEFLRLAAKHPNLKIGALTAHSNAGERLGDLHPHLRSLADRVLEPTTAGALAGHDVVVFAVPHGASGDLARQLRDYNASVSVEALETTPPDPIFVDVGADHRLVDPGAWKQFYGSEHAGTWTYGMPELINGETERATGFAPALKQREELRHTKEIAVPGCNVTAVTLGLQPGFADGVLDPSDVVAVLAVGYSGAGKAAKTHLLASEGLGSAAPYAVGGVHRHIPEIQQNLSLAGGGYIAPNKAEATPANDLHISFTPVLVPMSRGILAVASAKLSEAWQIMLDTDPTEDKSRFKQWLREVWEDTYRGEPFIQLLPAGVWPKTADVVGSNNVQIQVDYDLAAGRVITITALDNLVKGTAGAAIQSLNLALGLPETTALDIDGVAP